ncbi:LuxR C-terminal-related transcriptional regulator [Parasynechococcus sp.]|uniref:LuxR C-terminal-related transcriptional regulator n=1 Tax=Parasynechococcus sp. TaxID=3101203 RepID=UPI0037045E20
MELPIESGFHGALKQVERLLAQRRVVAVMGDRLTLCSFVLAEPVRPSLIGAATTEDEGFALVQNNRPDLLICSEDLETGYGLNLLKRVRSAVPNCQMLIVLVRETQEVVQEALAACADGVIFKSSLGSGHGDLISALQTIAEGAVYYPEQIRGLAAASAPNPDLPALIEELTPRELEVVAAVSRGLKNNAIADQLGVSLETVKTHVGNSMAKLAARDRTQMAVTALLYGLINPLD